MRNTIEKHIPGGGFVSVSTTMDSLGPTKTAIKIAI